MIDDVINNKKDSNIYNINSVLKNSNGLTITEIVKKSKLYRSAVRTTLAKLEGAEKVFIRKVGMAKLYLLKKGKGK